MANKTVVHVVVKAPNGTVLEQTTFDVEDVTVEVEREVILEVEKPVPVPTLPDHIDATLGGTTARYVKE